MEIPERVNPHTPLWIMGAGDHLQRYHYACRFCQGKRVLDVGCGVGYGSAMLCHEGSQSVLGIDISSECVESARSNYQMSGLAYEVDDACELKKAAESDPFDLIVSFENIEHLEKPERFIESAIPLLATDGLFIISTPDSSCLEKDEEGRPLNEYHLSEMTEKEFRTLMDKYFEKVEYRYQVQSLEGLRAQRIHNTLQRLTISPMFLIERVARKIMGRPSLLDDLAIRPESDFEIVPKPNWETPVWSVIALARKPRILR